MGVLTFNGLFKKTYENVEKFNEKQQKAYLGGLVGRTDVRLDGNTNEHMLDIKLQCPMVNDRYIPHSDRSDYPLMSFRKLSVPKIRWIGWRRVKKRLNPATPASPAVCFPGSL